MRTILVICIILLCTFQLGLGHCNEAKDGSKCQDDDKEVNDDEFELLGDDIIKDDATIDHENLAKDKETLESIKSHSWSTDKMMNFVVKVFTGRYYQTVYRTSLKDALISHVNTSNVTENMEVARTYLKWKTDYGKSFKRRSIIGALEQFVAMDDLQKKDMCTRRSFKVLFKNDKATRGKTHRPKSKLNLPKLNRVESIVHYYTNKHAYECRDVYPRQYRSVLEKMNKLFVERVVEYTDALMKGVLFDNEGKLRNTLSDVESTLKMITSASVRSPRVAETSVKLIKTLAKNDTDVMYLEAIKDDVGGKKIVKKDKVALLFKTYLAQPCKYYVQQLGPDVFVPAKFDVELLEMEKRYKFEEDQEFGVAWIRFRLCYMLTRQKRSVIDDIVAFIKKRG